MNSPVVYMAQGLYRAANRVRRRARLLARGESPRHFFDIHDRHAVNRLLAEFHEPLLEEEPREYALRLGHPHNGEQIFELREDVRLAIPLALTPAQRGEYLRWFLAYGRDETDVTFADVLRELIRLDQTPDRGLMATYRVQPRWQEQHPNALSEQGWEAFKAWVSEEWGVRSRWLTRAERPRNLDSLPTQPGLNVLGLFRYTSGLQQAAISCVGSLRAAGLDTALRDLPMPMNREEISRSGFDSLERYPVTLLNTGLDMPVAEAYRLAGLHRRSDVYRIGMWWWELEDLPEAYRDRGEDVDEIWAPTSFIAKALSTLGKPVEVMLPGVRLPEFARLTKPYFGLKPSKFTFLFVFDMNSRMPRKNPLGLIRAFRLAFRPEEPVELVIKVSPQGRFYADWWQQLRSAAAEARVTLIDRSLDRPELLALMAAADAYVSLHRSEGFGLTLAEAMLMGKPTIATGYSGNLDFMTSSNSYLVNYARVKLDAAIDPYPAGAVWAEPDVHHAAMLMSRVYEHPVESQAIGARGRSDLQRLLSLEAAGQRMADRLAEIDRRFA